MMKLPRVNIREDYFQTVGGEDLISPTITVDPGRAIITQNYELDTLGRYRLIDGYEAFDGRPKPSAASYWILNFDAGSVEIDDDDILTGAGGASGIIMRVSRASGTWAGGDAAGYVVLFGVTGDYVDDETLSVLGGPVAVANGVATERGYADETQDTIWLLAAVEATRGNIAGVAGSGNILGVWQYKGVKYAFRNNAGGTAAVMFKSSTSGWTAVDLGRYLAFSSGGVTEISEADTIEGETGGATATVERVVLQSGTWAGGDAAGYFILSGQTGTFESETVKVGVNLNLATITTDSTVQTLLPDGRYEFVNKNFRGHSNTARMYGCDGVNKGFEFDGTVYTPIETGMTTDKPVHITAHKKHLFFIFPGGSIQHSSTGDPLTWSAITGSAELALGDEGVAFVSMPNTLAIFTRNTTHILYGSSTDDWDLRPHSNEAGAVEWSVQKIGLGIYLDDRGLTSLSAVQEYGDFKANTLSKYVDPFLKTMMGNVQSSARVKSKNQYRLFFDDLQVLTLNVEGNKVIGFTRQFYDHLPVCVCSSENTSGEEEIFFGSTDGYVYELDKGTSFNGDPIEAMAKFHFNHLKSPRRRKQIRGIVLELAAPADTYLSANVEFDYGETANAGVIFSTESQGGIWGVANWGEFYWDGGSKSSQPLDVDAECMNFSLTVYYSGVWELQEDDPILGTGFFPAVFGGLEGLTGAVPHTLQGYIVLYDLRSLQR